MPLASDSASSEPFFKVHSPPSSTATPRLGNVLGRLPTPNVLTYTQHGLPPHLTVDNWRHLPDMTAFHIPLASFISQPSASALACPPYPSPPSLASYLRYPPHSFLLLSLSDPLLPVQQCGDASVVVASPQGNQRVTPLQLVQRARVLRPDALLLVSDSHTAASEAERGREKKAVWRTLSWMKEQLQTLYGSTAAPAPQDSDEDNNEESGERKTKRQKKLDKQDAARLSKGQTNPTVEICQGSKASADAAVTSTLSAANHDKPPHIIAPVPLTSDTTLQHMYITELLAHSHLVDGYSVVIPPARSDAALSLLPAVLSQLPAASLRLCSSHPPSLSSLFSAACSGIDLISTALPYHHSLLGLALSLHSPALSLHSPSLVTSALPLAPNCRCYTCTHHTAAYLHHLLRVKEMTAMVLLDLHNTHTVMELMRAVRERLAAQEGLVGWQQWRDEWMQRLEANERIEKEDKERERQKETKDASTESDNADAVNADSVAGRPQVPIAIS